MRKLLSRRYSLFGNNHHERDEIENIYNNDKWSSVIELIKHQNHISKQKFFITPESIKLAKKINIELNIDVFPVVIRLHHGYLQRSCGAWSFYMLMPNLINIGSCEKVSYLLKKNTKLDMLNEEIIGVNNNI